MTVGICMETDEFKNMARGSSDQLLFMTKLLCLQYLNTLQPSDSLIFQLKHEMLQSVG